MLESFHVSVPRETPSNTVATAEILPVTRLSDPALALLIRLRGQGYGWEDCCVLLQREGLFVSKSSVRRFILGPNARRPRSQGHQEQGR
jgi:hypothetical protein